MVQLTYTIQNETIAQNAAVIIKAIIAPNTGSLCAISKKIPSQKRKYPNAIYPVLCAVEVGDVANTRTITNPNIKGVADKTDHHPPSAFITSKITSHYPFINHSGSAPINLNPLHLAKTTSPARRSAYRGSLLLTPPTPKARSQAERNCRTPPKAAMGQLREYQVFALEGQIRCRRQDLRKSGILGGLAHLTAMQGEAPSRQIQRGAIKTSSGGCLC